MKATPIVASLVLCLAASTAGMAQDGTVMLQLDNPVQGSVDVPAQPSVAEGCDWAGPATVLIAGARATFSIVPAGAGSPVWPCHVELQMPLVPESGVADTGRMDLGLDMPEAGIMIVDIAYSYPVGGQGPWASVPVARTQLAPGPDGVFALDLQVLAAWITENDPPGW